jgi:hypothetical protein
LVVCDTLFISCASLSGVEPPGVWSTVGGAILLLIFYHLGWRKAHFYAVNSTQRRHCSHPATLGFEPPTRPTRYVTREFGEQALGNLGPSSPSTGDIRRGWSIGYVIPGCSWTDVPCAEAHSNLQVRASFRARPRFPATSAPPSPGSGRASPPSRKRSPSAPALSRQGPCSP